MIQTTLKEEQNIDVLGSLETKNKIDNSNVFVFFSTEFDALEEKSDLTTKQLLDNNKQFLSNFCDIKEIDRAIKNEEKERENEIMEEVVPETDIREMSNEKDEQSEASTEISDKTSLTIEEIERKDIQNNKEQDFNTTAIEIKVTPIKPDITPAKEEMTKLQERIEKTKKKTQLQQNKPKGQFDYNFCRTIMVPTWLEQIEENISVKQTALLEHLLIFTNLMIFLFAIIQINRL